MRSHILICLVISFVISGIALSDCPDCDYKEGELLVRFDESGGEIPMSLKQNILNTRVPGSAITKEYEMVSGLCLVLIPDDWTVPEAQQAFGDDGRVLYAEPNYKRQLNLLPNDTRFNELWAMNNTGQTGGTSDADIDAPEGWDIETGSSDIVVAVVDSGAYYNHPDLSANMWVNTAEQSGTDNVDDDGNGYVDDIYGYDFVGTSGTPDSDPCDTYGHGTHVAGTIGAVGNNSEGVTGVCWETSMMSLKVCPDNSTSVLTSATVEAVQYAADNGADVINASFGGPFYSQAEYDAIEAAKNSGLLFVAGAGNNGTDNDSVPFYPASYDLDNIISVLATDDDDQIASFSCYGQTSVDIGAPGSLILSCQNLGGYISMSGTSMATPHVAGAAALLWSLKPGFNYSQIKNAIMTSADVLPSLNGLSVTGGRLNVSNGLELIDSEVLNKDTMIIYDSIQGAIDAASSGDELIADADNSYFESIDFMGKDILLRSGDIDNPTDPTISPRNTYISGVMSTDSVVTFQSGETSAAVLKGFTITDGQSNSSGGGISIDGASPTITECIIKDNKSFYDGGGISIMGGGTPDINDCEITGNNADFWGGGIYCDGAEPEITNCLIAGNETESWEGAGIYLIYSSADILNCTISGNRILSDQGYYGGGICLDYDAHPMIKDCIFSDNEDYAIHEYGSNGEPSELSYCLFYNNPDGDYDDYNAGVLTGKTEIESLPEVVGGTIVDEDPLFTEGQLGSYYLSHEATGQASDSAAVDEGSVSASVIGLNAPYSTRTDKVEDTDEVDLGYHYKDAQPVSNYTLTIEIPTGHGTTNPMAGTHIYTQYQEVKITADPDAEYQLKSWSGTHDDNVEGLINYVTMDSDKTVTVEFETTQVELRTRVIDGGGDIAQNSHEDWRRHDYPRGTVVNLTADPCDMSKRVEWSGTDDDGSHSVENTVTMTEPKIVSVEFVPVKVLHVEKGGSEYDNIQDAIYAAEDGDTIVIHPGNWELSGGDIGWYDINNKAITVTSVDPHNSEIVADTVLSAGMNIINCGRDTVINGLTFENFHWFGGDGLDGGEFSFTNDGSNGASLDGGAMILYSRYFYPMSPTRGSSPTVKNCVFNNVSATGGNGGDGVSPFGDGGWGGWGRGGAVAIGADSNPRFVDCQFIDCFAVGGNGGNGSLDPAAPGRGGLYDQDIIGSTGWYWGPYDHFIRYSGYGGAVFMDVNSTPEFEDCVFTGNRVYGGCSGDGSPLYPEYHYKIDRYGGAVYISADCKPTFTDCVFEDNAADVNEPFFDHHGDPGEATTMDSVYLAFGGAIAIDTNAVPKFVDCEIIDNFAHLGGGMYSYRSLQQIDGCTLSDNSAFIGGGMLVTRGTPRVARSEFSNNTAELYYEPNGFDTIFLDTEIYGEGGALGFYGANGMISDCQIQNNTTGGWGGGVYISSRDLEGEEAPGDNSVLLKNCLITNNSSVIEGGGISANWYSDPNIISCTIAGNSASGEGFDTSYGGGVASAYNNYTQIRDSIIWGNTAGTGPQISVRSSQPGDPQPSAVKVRYSDVAGGAAGVYVDTGDPETSADDCLLDWDYGSNLDGTSLSNPLFVKGPLGGNYYLSQSTASPSQPDSPCVDAGSGNAHSLDMYRHTTRTDRIIDGLNPDNYPDAIVDMGYHYLLESELIADFDYDDAVNSNDFVRFWWHLSLWETGCEFPYWCHEKDLNKDGKVDFTDYAIFALNFPSLGDGQPPYPNPATWDVLPEPNSATPEDDFYMAATRAFDNGCGNNVEYWFERRYEDANIVDVNSGWQDSRSWTDSSVSSEVVYGYRVKARDCSGNETGWSVIAFTQIGGPGDLNPPSPDPMTWATVPYSLDDTSISMTATAASDPSGVEYYFDETSGNAGGTDSGWQDSMSYTDTGLTEGTEYCYRVKARDKSINRNETGYSTTECATAGAGGGPVEDTTPPDANGVAGYQTNSDWIQTPIETTTGGELVHTMTATTADDTGYGDNNPCEYYFECYIGNGHDSGWQTSTTYTYVVHYSKVCSYRVRARDAAGNQTGWSSILVVVEQTGGG